MVNPSKFKVALLMLCRSEESLMRHETGENDPRQFEPRVIRAMHAKPCSQFRALQDLLPCRQLQKLLEEDVVASSKLLRLGRFVAFHLAKAGLDRAPLSAALLRTAPLFCTPSACFGTCAATATPAALAPCIPCWLRGCVAGCFCCRRGSRALDEAEALVVDP